MKLEEGILVVNVASLDNRRVVPLRIKARGKVVANEVFMPVEKDEKRMELNDGVMIFYMNFLIWVRDVSEI